ncbi:MAG: efflux RND transporter periplasmic adaptor subunit [Pirellulaceae bacterium]
MNIRSLLFLSVVTYSSAISAQAETISIEGAQLAWVDDVLVSSRDAGVVKELTVKPNDDIKQESVIVRLNDDVHQTDVKAAQTRLAIAQQESENDVDLRYALKSAEVAGKELQRAKMAIASFAKAVSKTELERTELQLQQALLSAEQARQEMSISELTTQLKATELETAQLKFAKRTVRAPFDGQIADVLVQPGQWVDLGQPVARLVNLNRLRIVALVSEQHLLKITKNQPAKIQLLVGDQEVAAKGEISFISPEINPVNREFTVWVDVNNPDQKLRPGMVGTLKLDL